MSRVTHVIRLLGTLGVVFAVGGLIVYTLLPRLLWLVTLSEGLAILCLIVFAVFHVEALKAFSLRRSTRLGTNSIIMAALVVGILAIINFLAARHTHRWDWSETQRFTLAPQTYRVLKGLSREVKVTVFSQERSPGFDAYRDLLDSYQHAGNKLTVSYVDPDRQPSLVRQYGITRADTAVVESGAQSTRITTPSEAELTSALIRVSKDSKKKVLFLEGHGERAPSYGGREGLSMAKEALVKQGYAVDSLSLLQQEAVPTETDVLVIAGPRQPVTKEEQERIRRFVFADGGGHLLIMVDPQTQTGLEDLLLTWGVRLGPGVLVDLQDRLALGDLTTLLVKTFTAHEITQDFAFAVLFPFSRYLTFDTDKEKDWEFVPLARTSLRSWADTNLKEGQAIKFDKARDIQGPLILAATLTRKMKAIPEEDKIKPAIVVVGNSSFVSNAYLNFPGNTDFFLHTIGWLAKERELISITPKEPAFRPFLPNPTQDRLLLYVQVLLLPFATFFVGMAIWRKRRRL